MSDVDFDLGNSNLPIRIYLFYLSDLGNLPI